MDCTPDVSRKEQMTVVFRYVHFDSQNSVYQLKESFVEYVNVTEKTGEGMTDSVKLELEKLHIDIMDMDMHKVMITAVIWKERIKLYKNAFVI